MGQVLSFNKSSKARGETLSSATTACLDIEEQRFEICAKYNVWIAELSSVVADLEKMLDALNDELVSIPESISKTDLEDLRAKILVEIYRAQRFLADV
jgi:hypothetical protein